MRGAAEVAPRYKALNRLRILARDSLQRRQVAEKKTAFGNDARKARLPPPGWRQKRFDEQVSRAWGLYSIRQSQAHNSLADLTVHRCDEQRFCHKGQNRLT